MNLEEALEYAEELLEDLDDIPDRGEEFRESVREKIEGMCDWMNENQHVTDKMITALQNMRRGVDGWLR